MHILSLTVVCYTCRRFQYCERQNPWRSSVSFSKFLAQVSPKFFIWMP